MGFLTDNQTIFKREMKRLINRLVCLIIGHKFDMLNWDTWKRELDSYVILKCTRCGKIEEYNKKV